MMREQQQYRTSDYKHALIDSGVDRGFRADNRRQKSLNQGGRRKYFKRSSMSRNATIVLAILLVLGSYGPSASAFAGDGGAGAGVRGNNLRSGFGGTPADRHDGCRADGLRGEFRGYGGRDVWGHWGAYYGPMIPMI
jgi:hypothetical protein